MDEKILTDVAVMKDPPKPAATSSPRNTQSRAENGLA